jgi:hypothetical protein
MSVLGDNEREHTSTPQQIFFPDARMRRSPEPMNAGASRGAVCALTHTPDFSLPVRDEMSAGSAMRANSMAYVRQRTDCRLRPSRQSARRESHREITMKTNYVLVLAVVGAFAAGQSLADKPSWAGGGKGKGQSAEHGGKSESRQGGSTAGNEGPSRVATREYFADGHRTIVREYYSDEFRSGRCPPGLAKKHNGCMPPGQAKKWTVGRPLPRDVIYYDVPAPLLAQLDRAPAGHRYARVASDILLITLGSGTVIDAIQNLGRS